MDIAFATLIALLGLFVILAMFDGLYLHLIRYKLYTHRESRTEHIMHTIRSMLFPLVLVLLYLGTSDLAFFIGLGLVLADVAVLAADAWLEKDSRAFMGGLPRWEYILHLMVNGFHSASIGVFLVLKLRLTERGISVVHDFAGPGYSLFITIVTQLLPGAVLMALLHAALLFPKPVRYIHFITSRIKCCGSQPHLQ